MAEGNGNGLRPRASAASIINGAILAVMLLGGGVSSMLYLGAIRTDIIVLQNQIVDLRAWAIDTNKKLDLFAVRK